MLGIIRTLPHSLQRSEHLRIAGSSAYVTSITSAADTQTFIQIAPCILVREERHFSIVEIELFQSGILYITQLYTTFNMCVTCVMYLATQI